MKTSLMSYLMITVVLGGGAAWMTGRAIALIWQPLWRALAYCLLLALAVRFFHYALAEEVLLSGGDLLMEIGTLWAITALAHRTTSIALKARQYPWLYRRTSPFTLGPADQTGARGR